MAKDFIVTKKMWKAAAKLIDDGFKKFKAENKQLRNALIDIIAEMPSDKIKKIAEDALKGGQNEAREP